MCTVPRASGQYPSAEGEELVYRHLSSEFRDVGKEGTRLMVQNTSESQQLVHLWEAFYSLVKAHAMYYMDAGKLLT